MKILKKAITGFLFLILVNLIVLLVISCNLKETLVDGILKTVIQENIKSTEDSVFYNNNDIQLDIDNSQIQEILNSKEIQGLLEKYMDITIDGIDSNDKLDEINIEKDIIDYLKKNKESLSNILGQDVTDEMISEAYKDFDSKEKSKVFKETIINTRNNLTKSEKLIIKIYKILISKIFKYVILGLIFLNILFLALIQKSFHKWINKLGSALLISGILLLSISLISKLIISGVSGLKGVNISNIQITGVIFLIIGIFMLILCKITSILIKKDKSELKNEVS